MLENLRNRMASDESGFTLIELLVVMLILGILAAIAVPSFLSQRDKASDAEAKAEVRTAQTAAETYFTDEQTFLGMADTDLEAIEPTLEGAALSLPVAATADTYVVEVAADTGNTFRITRAANGTSSRQCTGDAGCVDNTAVAPANGW